MTIGLLVMLFVLSLFGGRLIQVQGLDASALASAALDIRQVTVELPARRGDITDAQGAVLATTVDRRDVRVDQTLVTAPRHGGIAGAAQQLAPVLRMPVAEITAKLTGTSRGAFLTRNITPELARQVLDLKITGVDTPQASRRVYPANDLAANVLGFVAADGKAYGGVEGGFDDILAGTSGSLRYEQAKDGTRIPTGSTDEVDPRDGGSVRLTIDRDLQWKAQQLAAAQAEAVQAESICIVAMDPRTGQVLALATAPTFDPNKPGKAPESARGNRPLTDVFEPGSTSKVITLAAALEEKVVDPLTRVTVPNRLERADRRFRDAEEHGVEQLTAAGVLAKSSNIGTIMLGEKVAPATMERYMRAFGLGAKTGVGLPESAGILAPAAQWNGSQRYTVLFGQGLSVNALQAAQVFSTIANDGVRMPPSVVAGFTAPDGTYRTVPTAAPVRVLSAATAQSMRAMMEGVVVEGGTAVKAAVPGYRVAGKTGTAQRAVKGGYSGYTASFIGMAPAENPALVVAVIVQNPQRGHYGGEVAAPVFRDLMTYALAHQSVTPSTSKPAQIPTTWR
ncbi:MAG: penicillin-binding protein 2 [Kineosporiaceae bacterium]|nr:penicillin-binding protein 2 [Kineosporiaceae bacterium]